MLVRMQHARLGNRADVLRDAVSLRLDDDEWAAGASINQFRNEFAASDETIQMEDFGAGTRGSILSSESKPNERHISEIYKRAATSPAWGRFLFRLVRAIKPRRVLELGTNLGVSALHIVAALDLNEGEGSLTTIEGDPTLSEIARKKLAQPAFSSRSTVLTGRFDDVLPTCLEEHRPYNLVFIDGHHEEAATLRYFEMIKRYLAPGACVAFDDIEPFRPVRKAWKRIIADEPNSAAVDLLGIGLWFAPLDVADKESDAKHSTFVQ